MHRFHMSGVDFLLKEVEWNLGTLSLRHWRPIPQETNLNRVLDVRPIEEKWWPYWLEDWPIARALGKWVLSLPSASGACLDLGCGSGLLGQILAMHFPGPVYLLDQNADACRLSHLNVPRSMPFCADMRMPPFTQTFRWIAASDMLYSEELCAWIAVFLNRHLGEVGEAWIGDPGRRTATGFPGRLQEQGLNVRTIELEPCEDLDKPRLFRVTRGAHQDQP